MKPNLLFYSFASKLAQAKRLYFSLFALFFVLVGQAQVSILEGDTAYICTNGRLTQTLSVTPQVGYSYKWYNLDRQSWYKLGNSFGDNSTPFPSVSFTGNTPYTAIQGANNKVTVLKYDGTDWVQVGSQVGAVFPRSPKVAFKDDTAYVAFIDIGFTPVRAAVYKYDGTNWVQVGANFGTPELNYHSLDFTIKSGTPYLSFIDGDSSNRVSVYSFNNTAWVPVGASFGPNNSFVPTLRFNGDTAYVAISTTGTLNTQVYKFNGTTWQQVGTAIGAVQNSTSFRPSLAFKDDTTFVAFTDGNFANATSVYKFDGATWVKVGGPFGTFGNASLGVNSGMLYAAIRDLTPNGVSLFSFDGSTWGKFSNSIETQYIGEQTLAFNLGAPHVIFKEASPGVISVYKFGPNIFSDSASFTADTLGTYIVEATAPNGVLSYDTIVLLNPVTLTGSTTSTNVGCSDANINLVVNGGQSPYTYQWSNGATSQNLTSVGLGYYSVLITDALGCTLNKSIVADAAVPSASNFINQNDTALICNTNPAYLSVTAQPGAGYKWYKTDSVDWQSIAGNSLPAVVQNPNLTVYEGTPYIVLNDPYNGSISAVYYYNGLNWQQLGGAISGSPLFGQKIVFHNGTPYVIGYSIMNGQLSLYKFDGINWVQVGSSFGNTYIQNIELSFDGNTPYVGFIDFSNNRKLAVYKFDGAAWVTVGNTFGGDYSSDLSLQINAGIVYVAFQDGNNLNRTTLNKFDGTNWVQVGSTFGGDYSNYASLAFNNAGAPFVAIGDGGVNAYQTGVYQYNGSNWVLVGARFGGGNSNNQYLTFNANEPYVVFSEGSNSGKSSVYKYNGSSWVKLGNSQGSRNTYNLSLAFANGTPYTAFNDGTDNTLKVHKLGIANISNTPTTIISQPGLYVAIETATTGCRITDTVRVIQQSIVPPTATIASTTTTCSNANTGAVNLSVTGGASPYNFIWSTNDTTQNITNLMIGEYSVLVIDSIGCTATTNAKVLETPVAQATIITQGDSAFSCSNSNAQLSINSLPGYAYQWFEIDSLTLQPYGDAFGSEYSYYQSLKVNDGITYVAFADNDNNNKTSVYKYDGTTWVKLGSSFGTDFSYYQSLYFMNDTAYVAASNDGEETSLHYFNGTNWVQVGSSLANSSYPVLSSKANVLHMIVRDEANDGTSSVYKLVGSTWVQVGSTFGGESSEGQTLVISDTTLYAALNDGDLNNTNSVYVFNGTNWVQLGSSFGSDYSGYPSLAINNGIPYVAFDDGDNDGKAAVYKYDSVDWVQVGNFFGVGRIEEKVISFNDSIPYVVINDFDGHNGKMVLYQFNGTKWAQVGKPLGGEDSYSPSLVFDDGIAYLAFSDGDMAGQSVVYKFGPTPISSALAIATNRVGLYAVNTADINGCRLSDTIAVANKNLPAVAATTLPTTTCISASTGMIGLTLANATAPISYNWSNGQSSQNANMLAIGTYSVIATDSNGCSVSVKAKVTETPAASVNIINQGAIVSQCSADTTLLSVSQLPGHSYKWLKADSSVWQQIGGSFGGENSAVQRLVFDGNIPYVAFRDADDDGRIAVYTRSGNNWVQVGNTFGEENYTGWIDELTLSLQINNGEPYVAFSDYNDYKIWLYKFDGTDWVQIGDKFGGGADFVSLAFIGNTPYVAFNGNEDYDYKSVVYYFDGADWTQLGDAFGEYDCEYQSLAFNNGTPYVAFVDGDDYESYVYKYDGTNWVQEGNSFGDEEARYHNLVFDNGIPYVSIAEDDGYNSVFQFNGTDWVKVGPSFGNYAYFNSLAFNNGVPYVALSDDNEGYQNTIYKFNGATWELVGDRFGGESRFQSIVFNNGELYLAASTEDNDYETSVYKFAAAEIDNTNDVIVETPGMYVVQSTNPDGCVGLDTVIIVNYLAASNNNLGANQVVCNGSAPANFLGNTPGLGDTATYSYTWLVSTVSDSTGFTLASGVNNAVTYTSTTLTDTTWYKRIVNSSVCGIDTSDVLAIFVTADSAGMWTGAQDWKWQNPANWGCPSIPTGVSRVTIPSSVNYYPTIEDKREVLDLTIQSGAYLWFANNTSELTIFGNVTNNGSFNPYSGKVVFAGSTQQTIPGNFYRKLEINNANGVILNGSVNVNDSLILKNGIVQIGAHNLTLSFNGVASKGSPTSYVSTNGTGKLISYSIGQYNLKSDTVYIPIGNSTYNPIVMVDKNNNSNYEFRVIDSVTSTYNGYVPTDTMYTNGAVNRTWVIEQSNGGANTASISFGWTAANELPFFDRNNSFVSYYNYNDTEWVTRPGTIATGSSIYYQTITGIPTNNVFTIGSGNGVGLPVNLVNFTATKQQLNVNLRWTTTSEINNDYFELQRSVDGRTFETITRVKGNGTTNIISNYQYLDTKVFTIKRPTPNVFYRLIQTDFDGTKTTSKTVVVNMDAITNSQTLAAAISPNPFADVTNILIASAKAELATIKVTDTQGRLVFEKQIALQEGENPIVMSELSNAETGIYFVAIYTSTESLVQRIAKAK